MHTHRRIYLKSKELFSIAYYYLAIKEHAIDRTT